jgi:hypothetical protein
MNAVHAARETLTRIGVFLGSLKGVVVQTSKLAPLRVKHRTQLTRTQIEALRENTEALVPTVFLAMSQFVPVLGNVPVVAAIAYPRLLLSTSFFDATQLRTIREEEWKEKEAARGVLLSSALVQPESAPAPLETLPSKHLAELSKAQALYANKIIYAAADQIGLPFSVFIRRKLEKRASEIEMDDVLLRELPGGLEEGLTEAEASTAATRRGASPQLTKAECIEFIEKWLATEPRAVKRPSLTSHRLSLPWLQFS